MSFVVPARRLSHDSLSLSPLLSLCLSLSFSLRLVLSVGRRDNEISRDPAVRAALSRDNFRFSNFIAHASLRLAPGFNLSSSSEQHRSPSCSHPALPVISLSIVMDVRHIRCLTRNNTLRLIYILCPIYWKQRNSFAGTRSLEQRFWYFFTCKIWNIIPSSNYRGKIVLKKHI